MHVRSQMTLNAREVDLVLGLLTRNVHVHLSRLSSISGTDFVSLLDDAIESILDPTETVTARNTGTTITTNDTSSGATSSLSASQSGAATQSKAFVAYCSNNTDPRMFSYHSRHSCWQYKRLSWLWMRMEKRLANGVMNRWTHLLTLVKGNRIHLLSLCKSSRSRLLTICEGRRRCLVFLRSRSTVTMRKRRFLLQNLLSLTRNTMSESGPRWMKVATSLVAARVGQLVQNDISTCLVFSRSIASAPETRFSGLGGNTVAAVGRRKFPFVPAFTAERGNIHHLSGTIESWELPGDGPFLFPIDAQAKLGLIKDVARSRIFIENNFGFYLRMYKDAKTGLMLINVADFDLLNDQALTPQLLRASKPMYSLAATIPPPTCLTGGTNASGEHVDILRSLTRLPGNHTLRFTHVAIGLDVMDEKHGTDGFFRRYISERHCGRIRDFFLEIEKIAKCWSKLCVDDSQRRYIKRTSFSLIAVLSENLPALLCETIGEFIRPRSPRF